MAPGIAHQRILVTDEDPSVRALLAEVLADEGYRVSLSSAQDVAEVAKLDPDLILLDSWNATVGAPSDFLDRLQAEEATAAIPVIVLTGARHDAGDRAAYFAARDAMVVLKPFALDDLLTAIGERLRAAAVKVAAPFTLAQVNARFRGKKHDTPAHVDDYARRDMMNDLDLTKRDMTVDYGGRTFALRAYREAGGWSSVVIENKTPLRMMLAPTADAASCLAAAVQVVAALVDSGRSRRAVALAIA